MWMIFRWRDVSRLLFVVLYSHAAGLARSSLTPRATIRSVPSGSGCCSFRASSGGAVIQVSIRPASTGIAFGRFPLPHGRGDQNPGRRKLRSAGPAAQKVKTRDFR
jgi:hypothetical protein